MKICLKALAGIIVLTITAINLQAAVPTNSSNHNEQQQIQFQREDIRSPLTLRSPEKIILKSKQQAAEAAFNLSVANRDDFTLARGLIEEAIELNHMNLDYFAFATDIAFIAKEYDRAEEYQVMMLLVARSVLGRDDLQVAVILDQLAAINVAQKHYEEARYRLEEGLQLRGKVLGDDHLLIILSLNKLALLAIRQKLPMVAEPLLKRSLEIARRVSGPQHDNSATLLASLADFYQSEGRLEEAEIHYKEAH